jgi:hypothetical protein
MLTTTPLATDLLAAGQDLNSALTGQSTAPTFQAHYVDVATGDHGIAYLIAAILRENGAVFPPEVECGSFRPMAIGASMLTSEVFNAAQSVFAAGTSRYPLTTIRMYLSVFMSPTNQNRIPNLPRVGKIQLTNVEDAARPGGKGKPRCRWYLLDMPAEATPEETPA